MGVKRLGVLIYLSKIFWGQSVLLRELEYLYQVLKLLKPVQGQVGGTDQVETRVLSVTDGYATLQVPMASLDLAATGESSGGARGRVPGPSVSGAQRTLSLDRAAVTRMVQAAAAARSASAATRRLGGATSAVPQRTRDPRSGMRGKNAIIVGRTWSFLHTHLWFLFCLICFKIQRKYTRE